MYPWIYVSSSASMTACLCHSQEWPVLYMGRQLSLCHQARTKGYYAVKLASVVLKPLTSFVRLMLLGFFSTLVLCSHCSP